MQLLYWLLRYPQIHCAIGIYQANFGDKQTYNNIMQVVQIENQKSTFGLAMLRYPQIHCAIAGNRQANFGDKQTYDNFINILMGLHVQERKAIEQATCRPIWSTTQGTTQQEYKTKSFLSFSKCLYWKKMPMSHIPHGQAAFTTS